MRAENPAPSEARPAADRPATLAAAVERTAVRGLARSPEEAQARDRAVLDRLRQGAATFEQIAAAIPGEFTTAEARSAACRLSLRRMKAKGQITVAAEGYAVA